MRLRRIPGKVVDGAEKRKHKRFRLLEKFTCYSGGKKLLCLALDQGPGGAFLATSETLPTGAGVIVVPDEDLEKRSIYLVGRVMRQVEVPRRGVGLKWAYAVGLEGQDALRHFLRDHFKVPVPKEPTSSKTGGAGIQRSIYDFDAQSMLQVTSQEVTRLVGAVLRGYYVPRQDEQSPGTGGRRQEGRDERLQDGQPTVTQESDFLLVNIPVFYRFGGRNYSGVIRHVVSGQLVMDSSDELPEPGKKLRITVPVTDPDDGEIERTFSATTLRKLVSPRGDARIEVVVSRATGMDARTSDSAGILEYVANLGRTQAEE